MYNQNHHIIEINEKSIRNEQWINVSTDYKDEKKLRGMYEERKYTF